MEQLCFKISLHQKLNQQKAKMTKLTQSSSCVADWNYHQLLICIWKEYSSVPCLRFDKCCLRDQYKQSVRTFKIYPNVTNFLFVAKPRETRCRADSLKNKCRSVMMQMNIYSLKLSFCLCLTVSVFYYYLKNMLFSYERLTSLGKLGKFIFI